LLTDRPATQERKSPIELGLDEVAGGKVGPLCEKSASEAISMKKDLDDPSNPKKGKLHRPVKEKYPAQAEEISDADLDADLDKVTGGVVGPCDHARNKR
jgi:hypothetical protein